MNDCARYRFQLLYGQALFRVNLSILELNLMGR